MQTVTRFDPRSREFVQALGRHLLAKGTLDEAALRRAERAQHNAGERFDLVLTRLGLVSELRLARELADLLELPFVSQGDAPSHALHADELDARFLTSAKILPLAHFDGGLQVAMGDPFNDAAVDALAYQLGMPVFRAVMAPGELVAAVERLHGQSQRQAITQEHAAHGVADGNRDLAANAAADEGTPAQPVTGDDPDVRRLTDLASDAPVIRLVHDTIDRAVEARASDIHFEPHPNALSIRYRIDGDLQPVQALDPTLTPAVTSRIKIMAQLDIAERRMPQDGRIKATVRGREIDLRVSTMPTLHGESVVLRLLDRDQVVLDLAALGFEAQKRNRYLHLLREPNGIILVTGPTGSGKTTTLYASLDTLNDPARKLFTVEDPIEYQLEGVNQIQVDARIGRSFASSLRAILRQDPDIILVGEIRDLETAQVAVQASLTGHLVLSTVHTNSAAATIARLLDMGVEDYLLASSLKGILAQRLVRRLCDFCATESAPDPVLQNCLEKASLAGAGTVRIRKAIGCPACRNTGFRGRTMISEFLSISENICNVILQQRGETSIGAAACADGMETMFTDGLRKVMAGETTFEEILRVARGSP